MARHYRKNKQGLLIRFKNSLIETHWLVSLILALIIYLLLTYYLPTITANTGNKLFDQTIVNIIPSLKTFAPLFSLLFILLAFLSIMKRKSKKSLIKNQKNFYTLNNLDWKEFEILVAEAYRNHGYKVIENADNVVADGGIDLILKKEGLTSIVQCKHWQEGVTVKVVREMYGVMVAEKADDVKIITSNKFTKDAIAFAKGKPIALITGKQLLELIGINNVDELSEAKRTTATISKKQSTVSKTIHLFNESTYNQEMEKCPVCYDGALIKRTAKKGRTKGASFLGCDNYPKCKYTKKLRGKH